ncbi:MAG TPA: hypothetical protein VFE92_04760 [Dermatophilaceae bacterium]|jgi:hypothetical protein|nr:hypothetical protein [Dermatophilaceae bacterium]
MNTSQSTLDGHTVRCSAKGCRVEAAYGLLWNNPKLHAPERRKTWLACESHADPLSDFLSKRGFLKDAVLVSELTDEMG